MKTAAWLLLGIVVTVGFWTSQAKALPAFKKAFQKKYVDPSTSEDFKKAFTAASCNTCHVKGEKKTVRNDYGKALDKFIAANGGKKIKPDDLDKAFEDAAKENSAISGKTYGDLINDGKLPNSKD